MIVTKVCSCGNKTNVSVCQEKYDMFRQGLGTVQSFFPELNSFERECLITGMCFKCQSSTFNIPKPDENWGDIKDECENCGASLYAKDFSMGVCPVCQCGTGEV